MGGGAIRAASKVAGINLATGGLRNITTEHFPFSSTGRRATSVLRPATATAEDVKPLVASNLDQRPPCFAALEEEAVVAAGDPMPRVVFGGVPSLDEAKEATSELSVALEKAYLISPNSVGDESSVVADHSSILSFSNKNAVETKNCVTSDVAVPPAVPAPAITVFKFLRESSTAQNVVSSIACDPNVWNAVLQNQELQHFLQSQKACSTCSDEDSNMEYNNQSSPKIFNDSSEYPNPEAGGGFGDIFNDIKSSVLDMLSSLGDYFQNLFGGKGTNGWFMKSDGSARMGGDAVMEASFMGLAVMAILVILLKRAY